MRILQVANVVSGVGGIERYIERCCESLVRAGHQTHVVELDSQALPIPSFPNTFERAADPHAAINRWRPDVILSHQAGDGITLSRMVDTGIPVVDLVHTVLCPGGKLFRNGDRVCKHALGLRCIVDWYAGPCGIAISPLLAVRKISAAISRTQAMRGASLILVASEWMRQHVIGEGIDPARTRIVDISDGITGVVKPKRTPNPKNVVKLLCVGRLVYGKGVQYAIEVLAHLGFPFQLRVVGDGWYRAELVRLANRLGVSDKTEFCGNFSADQINEAYADADLLLVPSIWPEPAGLIVPEARAAGLPVIAFDRGGLPDWTRIHGMAGIALFDPSKGIVEFAKLIRETIEHASIDSSKPYFNHSQIFSVVSTIEANFALELGTGIAKMESSAATS